MLEIQKALSEKGR